MHRFPNGARFDVPGLQVLASLLRPDPEAPLVEQHTSQPAGRVTSGRFRQKRDPVDPSERRAIPSIDLASPIDELIQPRQLCTADRG